MGESGRSAGSAQRILLLAVLAAIVSQQVLVPVLAPLSREVGLTPVELGLVMTVAAGLFAVTSLFWGRVVDRWGHRRVLLAGLTTAGLGLTGFALVSQAALAGTLSPGAALAGMMATRSVVFGIGLGAVPTAAMALIAARTAPGPERTAGIGRLGAVQGVAVALGPALGALLAFAGLLGPVWLAPVAVLVSIAVVAVGVRPAPAAPPATGPAAPPPGPVRPWDAGMWPVLLTGFLVMLSLGLVLIVLGFLVQDRLGLDAAGTVGVSGAMSFLSGVALVLMQGVAVPRLGWPPVRLLRVGLPIATVGLLLLAVAPGVLTIGLAMTLLAAGLGLAMPGYTTAATLQAGPEGQGGVAGLVNATNGSTFVIGPLAGTALYTLGTGVPAFVAAVACLLGGLLAALHPALRSARPDPAATVAP
ncbi:MFS transporter [Pseudonocardia sp. NPDC046786]|uniref:MFS transporter n=1 Tax=Pseudonocardia sp. NPDC046786 TaxID=3155471 RepID=UPI0033F6545F